MLKMCLQLCVSLSLVPSLYSFKMMGAKYMATRLFMNASPISYKVGFMFPGQGAQVVGMGAALANDIPAAKALYDKASSILGYDLLAKCVNGPKEELDSTVIAQVAIFVSSIAALEKLKIEDPTAIESCTVAMGLSLGEYTALCFAGAISFEDGVCR
jgi:[acyl-carrier-protein] S-malonyltransferase